MPRSFLIFLAAVCGLVLVPVATSEAAAGAAARPVGGVWSAVQTGSQLQVTGWAYDAAAPAASVNIRVGDGRTRLARTRADRPSPVVNRIHHVRGKHRFGVTVTLGRKIETLVLRSAGARGGRARAVIAVVKVVQHTLAGTPAARVLAVARTQVGHARYVYGGTTPRTGFDCSGYTRWVYAQAHSAWLPRTADAQLRHAHRVSAAAARPGDLVFYLSGGSAYHVAIYAGRHMQYAAATPRDGIRYQAVWSSAVVYGRVLG